MITLCNFTNQYRYKYNGICPSLCICCMLDLFTRMTVVSNLYGQIMVATVRCEEIANEKLKELAENEVAPNFQF